MLQALTSGQITFRAPGEDLALLSRHPQADDRAKSCSRKLRYAIVAGETDLSSILS